MANKWVAHVRRTLKLKKNKGKPFRAVLKDAKKTYKRKLRGGGGDKLTAPTDHNPDALPPDGTKSPPLAVQGYDAYGSVKRTEDVRGGRRRRRSLRRT